MASYDVAGNICQALGSGDEKDVRLPRRVKGPLLEHRCGALAAHHSAAHGVALVSGFTGEFAAYSSPLSLRGGGGAVVSPLAQTAGGGGRPHDSAASFQLP